MKALPGSDAGERERYRVIAGLVTDVLFEYDYASGKMLNRVCRDGEFGENVWLDNPRESTRPHIHPSDLPLYEHFMEELESGADRVYVELRMKQPSGDYCWTVFEGRMQYSEDGKPFRMVGRIKEMEQQDETEDDRRHNLEKRDYLTRLLNRESCGQILEAYYRGRPEEGSVLILLDLDDFDQFNSEMGHLFGDEVRISIANTIKKSVAENDIVGRVGGDSYLICIRGIESRREAEQRAEEIQNAVASIYAGEKQKRENRPLSSSLGCVLCPDDGTEFTQLFERARCAATWCKENGRGKAVFWDKSMESGCCTPDGASAKPRGYDKFDESRKENYDEFGYDLMEMAFRLIEEHADIESAVNLLLRKVADYYDLSAICIREKSERPFEMQVTYEYLRRDYENFQSTLGQFQLSGEDEWNYFRNACRDGYYFYRKGSAGGDTPMRRLGSVPVQAMLEIPMYRKKQFVGCIDFCDAYLDREWSEREIRTLKTFGRIVTDFLLNMRDFEDTAVKMEQLKERDGLTGLYRYDVFLEKLQKVLLMPRDYQICLVSSDIRHFRYINEHYGVSVGDRLLRSFAEALVENGSNLLFACRVFSDNLVAAVRMPNGFDERRICGIVKHFNDEFSEAVRRKFFNGRLNVNSGYYLVREGDSAERAVSNANMARKHAKEPGNAGMTVMFEESMMDEIRRQVQLTDELPDAMKNRELRVFFQPKVECRSGKIIGAEALVRWKKPDGSFLCPDAFIPVFERNGSIVELDYYVYREVFAWLRSRLDAGEPVVPVSVNVSRFHLRDRAVLEYLRGLFEEYRIPAKLLEFELTENLYMENMDNVVPMALELRRMGAKVSMDDFGSGFSSLNVLNNLPIDVLKLDKVFMKNGALEEGDKAVLTCVVEMAKKLHIRVLCEGVENAEQDRFLCEIGCDMIQGYYYGRPMPVDEFEARLAGDEGA